MLAGMRDLIPHELVGHAHSDAEYKEKGWKWVNETRQSQILSNFNLKKREPINFHDWHKPGSGVYHKRGGAFDSLFYDYLTQ